MQQVQQCLDEVAWLRQRPRGSGWGASASALLGGVLASYEDMLRALLEA